MGWLVFIIDLIVPLATLAFIAYVANEAQKYYRSLLVVGKPNEWIVVINNGELKQAGIGLTLTRGPYDQVAVFPSKVNKISFSCQQITKEV
jgi:hypothetical protein